MEEKYDEKTKLVEHLYIYFNNFASSGIFDGSMEVNTLAGRVTFLLPMVLR